jgi:UDP-glucose 4-epimerase
VTVVVTGASGFVGSRLVGMLPSGSTRAVVRARVPYLEADVQVVADLLDGDLDHALDGATAVVHLAGQNEVATAADPAGGIAETVAMAWRVAEAAARAHVRRLVYVSTIHVYGPAAGSLREDVVPAPRSPYAVARLAAEHLVACTGVDTVVLRLSNAVGAPADIAVDRWTLVAADLSRQVVTTGRLALRTDGTQRRDFVALADVCATIAACTDVERVPAGTYNLASGTPMTVLALAEQIAGAFERHGSTRPPIVLGDEPAVAHRAADAIDVSRLARAGLAPPDGGLAAGIDELVAFCLEHEEELRCRSTE